MARIALLCPDLMFGSRLEEALRAAGHVVTRYDGEDMARAAVPESDVLLVDLAADEFDGATLVESMRMGRELEGVAAVGFYPHVDQDTRRRAEQAGYDLVVPRSRMAREAAALVEGVLATASPGKPSR
jgi:DNA-binding NarL/FixJ family response regulator